MAIQEDKQKRTDERLERIIEKLLDNKDSIGAAKCGSVEIHYTPDKLKMFIKVIVE